MVASIPVGNAPSALAVGDGAVWVVSRSEGTLSRVDPGTNATSGSVRVGTDLTGLAVGEGAVWVAGGEEGTVARVDAGDLRVVKKRKTGQQPVGGRGRRRLGVDRGRPVRGGASGRDAAGRSALDDRRRRELAQRRGLQPGVTWMVTSLAYDGLVAYRRVRRPRRRDARRRARDAAAGSQPRRAHLRLHAAQRHALLRRHAGQRHDFRASMERYLGATRDAFPPFFAGIVGARRCMSGRGRMRSLARASSRISARGRSPST